MHHSHLELQHPHSFHADNRQAGGKIGIVIFINAMVMVAEIIAGTLFGSMALTTDGWHMGTHILALGITLIAYKLAFKYMQDTRFAFGTWKIEILGSFTSALLLGIAGISLVASAIVRILHPVAIHYNEALVVAAIGLVVNIAGALILGHDTHAHHDHHNHGHTSTTHAHKHNHAHRDLNMRAAYIHIITDALTSVGAIIALFAAKSFGWNFIDPVAALAGSLLILNWTVGLLKESGSILLDREESSPLAALVQSSIESDGITRIGDMHVWQIARNKYACILVVATSKDTFTIADFKKRLSTFEQLVHVNIELHYLA